MPPSSRQYRSEDFAGMYNFDPNAMPPIPSPTGAAEIVVFVRTMDEVLKSNLRLMQKIEEGFAAINGGANELRSLIRDARNMVEAGKDSAQMLYRTLDTLESKVAEISFPPIVVSGEPVNLEPETPRPATEDNSEKPQE